MSLSQPSIGIIFDMDGTLVETSSSYLKTILETAFIYAKKILGLQIEKDKSKWFTLDHVHQIKSLPDFNNDFNCVVAIIGFLLENIALTTDSSLKACKSSIDPPPLVKTITSISG